MVLTFLQANGEIQQVRGCVPVISRVQGIMIKIGDNAATLLSTFYMSFISAISVKKFMKTWYKD